MTLTRAQYESAYGRSIVYFSLAVALATAVQVAVTVAVGSPADSTNVWLAIVAGIVLGIVAAFFAGLGSAIVTIVLGLVMTVAVERLLANVANWIAHFVAYFAIGALAAVVPVGLYVWAALGSESASQFAGDWLTILDLVVVVTLAGLSTSLAWHYVWRRGTLAEPIDATVEEVDA